VIGKLHGELRSLTLFVRVGATWTLLKTRNDVIFNDKVLASPKTIIHETILLVKLWKPLLMSKAHDMAETILGKLQEGLAEA
jgi:hypothetical protein